MKTKPNTVSTTRKAKKTDSVVAARVTKGGGQESTAIKPPVLVRHAAFPPKKRKMCDRCAKRLALEPGIICSIEKGFKCTRCQRLRKNCDEKVSRQFVNRIPLTFTTSRLQLHVTNS